VALSPDGKLAVLADRQGYAVLWSLPQPVQGDPEQITRWVQATVGMKLDQGDACEALGGPSWLKLQQRFGAE
jgi:hypothetical protein